jgi:hypothetical protein
LPAFMVGKVLEFVSGDLNLIGDSATRI